jgi:hypothetical protein
MHNAAYPTSPPLLNLAASTDLSAIPADRRHFRQLVEQP